MTIENHGIESLYENGIFMSASGNHSKALEYFDAVLKINPEHIDALINKAISLLKLKAEELSNLGKYGDAIVYLNKILEIKPSDVYVLRWKGISLANIGYYEDAIACLNRVLENKPSDVYALRWKGVALAQQGSHEDAIACFNQALEVEPDNEDALINKGQLLYHLNKNDEALVFFDKVLNLTNEQHTTAIYYKSIILIKQGHATPSIMLLERLLDLDPAFRERIQNEDAFKILSNNPRFKKLIEKFYYTSQNDIGKEHVVHTESAKSESEQLDIANNLHWIRNCLTKAKLILLEHHNSGEIINKFSFSIFVQRDNPQVYAYISGDPPHFRIGIHPELSRESELTKRMLVVVLIHELLHTIYGTQEGKVQYEEKILANRANYYDALVELENLALTGKMHFCPEN